MDLLETSDVMVVEGLFLAQDDVESEIGLVGDCGSAWFSESKRVLTGLSTLIMESSPNISIDYLILFT